MTTWERFSVVTAADARFYAFELDLRYHATEEEGHHLYIDLLMEQTRATNESFGTNLPPISTRRVSTRMEYSLGKWIFGWEGSLHEAASHLAPYELPTDRYFMWGADVNCRLRESARGTVDVFWVGSNLSDEEGRPHGFYLKDLTPVPGRSVKVGLRMRW
ncbi:hypothetical protein [Pelagicoccus sp. SDUM812002]|uniref:hypothetical protein n=1 Tax=Pelagicoccus sp. SDUM812002 TaxID=3041266 RepID=UPI00280C84B1|nr:hypothetical protein [Pelagicoccus sp. SDUM812002]MDQ8186581.1 hypothetical protein [Pelagicoccus sp. SDUM812002]